MQLRKIKYCILEKQFFILLSVQFSRLAKNGISNFLKTFCNVPYTINTIYHED